MDQRLRELERAARAGDPESLASYLRERVRQLDAAGEWEDMLRPLVASVESFTSERGLEPCRELGECGECGQTCTNGPGEFCSHCMAESYEPGDPELPPELEEIPAEFCECEGCVARRGHLERGNEEARLALACAREGDFAQAEAHLLEALDAVVWAEPRVYPKELPLDELRRELLGGEDPALPEPYEDPHDPAPPEWVLTPDDLQDMGGAPSGNDQVESDQDEKVVVPPHWIVIGVLMLISVVLGAVIAASTTPRRERPPSAAPVAPVQTQWEFR